MDLPVEAVWRMVWEWGCARARLGTALGPEVPYMISEAPRKPSNYFPGLFHLVHLLETGFQTLEGKQVLERWS